MVYVVLQRRCYDGTKSQRETKKEYDNKNESDSLSINFGEGRSLVMWGDIVMNILEDLYYGNVSPCERDVKRGSKVDKLQILVCQYEVELNSTLTEKQKEIADTIRDASQIVTVLKDRSKEGE